MQCRRVYRDERELAETVQRAPLQGNPERYECVVDDIPSIPLSGILAGAADGQVAQVSQVPERVHEAGHVCSGVEERRVLLRQHLAELRGCVLWTRHDVGHARVRRVEEANLVAVVGVDERREECGGRVRHVEDEVLDVVADAGQGADPGFFGEGGGVECEPGAGEEGFGEDFGGCGGAGAEACHVRVAALGHEGVEDGGSGEELVEF